MFDAASTADLGREVALRDIDRELRRLWEADTARTKASLMNLVIFSERPGSLAVNSALTRELTREQACRRDPGGNRPRRCRRSPPGRGSPRIVTSPTAASRSAPNKSRSC